MHREEKEHASFGQELDLFLIKVTQAEQKDRPFHRNINRYIATFWGLLCVFSFYFVESSSEEIMISIIAFFLNGLTNCIWGHFQPTNPVTAFLKETEHSEEEFFQGLTISQTKKQIRHLQRDFTPTDLIRIDRTQMRVRTRILLLTTIISALSHLLKKPNPSIEIIILIFIMHGIFHFMMDSAGYQCELYFLMSKMYKNEGSTLEPILEPYQQSTLDLFETWFPTMFNELKVVNKDYPLKTSITRNWQEYDCHHNLEQLSKILLRNFFNRSLQENEDYQELSIQVNTLLAKKIPIVTLYFPNRIETKNPKYIIHHPHILIDALAKQLSGLFAYTFIKTGTNTLKIAILPVGRHKPLPYQAITQQLRSTIGENSLILQRIYEYNQLLNQIFNEISPQVWQVGFTLDATGSLTAELKYKTHRLDATEQNQLIDALNQDGYLTVSYDNYLAIQVQQQPPPHLSATKQWFAAHKLKESAQAEAKKSEKIVEKDQLTPAKTYVPRYEQSGLDGFVSSLRSRVWRYSSRLWQNVSSVSLAEQPLSQYIFNFGTYGTYRDVPEEKNLSAIRRLKNINGVWTHYFIVLTPEMIKKINSAEPKDIQVDIQKRINEARIVPHTNNKQQHQASGFVIGGEKTKSGKTVHIKLSVATTKDRLYASKKLEYAQTEGPPAILFVLDCFEHIHKKTRHLSKSSAPIPISTPTFR